MKNKKNDSCRCVPNKIPVFCQLGVFSKEEFDIHKNETQILIKEMPREKKEIDEGFVFIYLGNEKLFLRLAQWVSKEHLCCAWARFNLEMNPFDKNLSQKGGTIVLTITGGKEGKQVLQQGFAALEDGNLL